MFAMLRGIKRSAGPYCRVLTFGAAAREEGGERAPGTQKSRIKMCKEPQLADTLSYGNPIACHLVGSVLRSRTKGEKEPHA
ncbi:unnamed protein product, partial [Staurois parvus]